MAFILSYSDSVICLGMFYASMTVADLFNLCLPQVTPVSIGFVFINGNLEYLSEEVSYL